MLQTPVRSDQVSGVLVLTALDLATSKLLDHSDRREDKGAFSRNLIDIDRAIDRGE